MTTAHRNSRTRTDRLATGALLGGLRATLRGPALAAGLLFLAGLSAGSARAENVSALIHAKTQQFSDAGPKGDAKTMARLLDAGVVFFNEAGDSATRDELVEGASPTPAGVTARMTVTDWHCTVHGNVAVASFIDEQALDFHGQQVHARFRSVETWLKEAGQWRMIGSQTLELEQDPVAVAVSPKTLDEYAGTYQAAPDATLTFARAGDELTAAANGGPATVQRAEHPDVFFTPGSPRARKIFQRDANGAVTGVLYRRAGHDIVFKRV